VSDSDLYSRQIALREIGVPGQEKLQASTFAPGSHLTPGARSFALRYAKAAGWGDFGDERPSVLPEAGRALRHPSAADVGLGALDVLSASLPLFEISPTRNEK